MNVWVEFVARYVLLVSLAVYMCPVTFKTALAQRTIIVISRVEHRFLNNKISYLINVGTVVTFYLLKEFLLFFVDCLNRIFFKTGLSLNNGLHFHKDLWRPEWKIFDLNWTSEGLLVQFDSSWVKTISTLSAECNQQTQEDSSNPFLSGRGRKHWGFFSLQRSLTLNYNLSIIQLIVSIQLNNL